MKKSFYILPILAMALFSCQDYYLEKQLGYKTTIEDVRNFSYSLTPADYSSIASNATNKASALAMGEDETDSTFYFMLQEVGTNGYFTYADTLISPDLFVPAFLTQKFPQLSAGTLCEVTYKVVAESPAYYEQFKVIRDVNPTVTIATKEDIPAALDTIVNNLMKKEGYKYLVNISDNQTYVFTYTNSQFQEYHNDQVSLLALTKADYASIGANQIDNPDAILPIFLKNKYPYATADTHLAVVYKNANRSNTIQEWIYDGQTWAALSDITEDVMSFEMSDHWKANVSTYLSEPFLGHGQGNFVIQNVYLQDPLTYTWYYSATYGMCTSAYKDGASWNSETWLVSPKVKLKKAKHPQLVFDQAFNKAPNFTEECTVLISTDYKDDVTTATWTALEWNTNEDGSLNVPPGTSWVFQTTGDLDLTAWAGKTIYIGFRYTTSNNISGTWELRNVLCYEPQDNRE